MIFNNRNKEIVIINTNAKDIKNIIGIKNRILCLGLKFSILFRIETF